MFRFFGIGAFLCLLATAALAETSTVTTQLPTRSGVFHIRLDPDRSVYVVGEPIQLRLTIVNATAQYYAVHWAPPWQQCRLLVADSKGQMLTSMGRRGGNTTSGRNVMEFPPGRSLVAEYPDPKAAFKGLQWADLNYWGYSLTTPGDYTITAVPELAAFERTNNMNSAGPTFITSSTDRSNVVRIRITR